MRIEQLQYFIETAKTHSFSLTAENLFVTQPTVSDAIKKLEAELGVTLFSRSKNGVYLTPIGETLYPSAQSALAATENIRNLAHQYLQSQRQQLSGHLKIEVSSAISGNILPQMLAAFTEAYPLVTLSIMERSGFDIWRHPQTDRNLKLFTYIAEEIDALSWPEPLIIEPLWSERFYAICHPDSVISGKKSISLAELCQYPLSTLSYYENDDSLIRSIFGTEISPQIVFSSSNREHVLSHVCAGKSIFITLSMSFSQLEQRYAKAICPIPINCPQHLKVYALYDRTDAQLAAITAFLDVLKKSH